MTEEKSMNKSTLGFIAIAAGLIGMLLGYSVTNKGDDASAGTSTGAATTTTAAATTVKSDGALPYRFIADSEFTDISMDEFGRPAPYNIGENIQSSQKVYKQQTLEVPLALDQTVEYKAVMEQGDSIVYEWSVDDGEVYTDFHAHPPGEGDFFTRYSEIEGSSDQGAIVAAYDGQHGWFWLNISDQPITITLKVAGFYDDLIEIDLEAEGGY